MSAKERVGLDVMHRVERNEMTVVSAAVLMCLSLRQARRLWKRYRSQGAAGLTHRSRGRASNRRLGEGLRERIVKRYQERYADFGPTLACEKLAEDGLVIGPDTLVALLKERHLWQRRRRRGKHRLRRPRRASFGSMIQMDGSEHDWFEGRSGWCVLMVLIDDASNQTYARFYPAETALVGISNAGRPSPLRGATNRDGTSGTASPKPKARFMNLGSQLHWAQQVWDPFRRPPERIRAKLSECRKNRGGITSFTAKLCE